MSLSDYIVVGKIIATHGIKGWLTIKSFTSNPKDIFSYNLEININNKITSINIDDYNFMPKKITMKLKELSRIEDAEDYITKDILVHKNNLPKTTDGEYYWYQLINCAVHTHEHVKIGLVKSLLRSGETDILIIWNDDLKKEIFIPLIKEYLIKVNLEDNLIIVKWNETF